jgi:2-amino-4-hydroxy-6-hydroxymethyldihydropteridine diphosphokinase
VCLSIGSNILPQENVPHAVDLLRRAAQVMAISNCYETKAVGFDGPNFINLALVLITPLRADAVKNQMITPIENRLERVRSENKNAPRTIDLDIILFNGEVVDAHLWERVHLALPVSELFPDLRHPDSGLTLREIAERLKRDDPPVHRPDFVF